MSASISMRDFVVPSGFDATFDFAQVGGVGIQRCMTFYERTFLLDTRANRGGELCQRVGSNALGGMLKKLLGRWQILAISGVDDHAEVLTAGQPLPKLVEGGRASEHC